MSKITYKYWLEHVRNNPQYIAKAQYEGYLGTERWEFLRDLALERDGHRCRMCGDPATCVHHREYPEVLGEESVDDLTSLCHRCHANYHNPPGIEEISRQVLEEKNHKRVKCPCCLRTVHRDKRKLNSGMARVLIAVYRKTMTDSPPDGWIHISNELSRKNFNTVNLEYSKLKHWGFLEPKPTSQKPSNGFWRITDRGKQFVERIIKRVQKHIYLYNDEFLGFSDEEVTLEEALGDHFNYEELMKA